MIAVMKYDVVIAGGSIAGLLCAREVAKKGHSVLVLEEDYEIGTPEHCGGLVSISALEKLGVLPHYKTFGHLIETAQVYAPNGSSFTINAKKQNVAEVNRRELDKQVARQAQKNGTEIKVKTSFQKITKNGVLSSDGEIDCQIVVDARGVSSIIKKDRDGILSSAQFEIYADWISKGKVEVYLDQEKYPGFFAWIIPSADGVGKVGVAGRGINASEAIEDFLIKKGKHSVIRKIFAPIWVKGPLEKFAMDKMLIVGDAAGQSKPTTAGGIFSCGMGGIFAGRAISRYLQSKNERELSEYQKNWQKNFGKEFEKQLFARRLLERLDNKTINKLFESITHDIIKEISQKDDFDFHTSSIVKILGVRGSIKTAHVVLGGEIKKLLS